MELIKKLHSQEYQDQVKEGSSVVFSERYVKMIDAHILGNVLGIKHFPLILAIVGRPGMGKTYQLRNYLSAVGVLISSVSSADLESDRAGEPAKLLQQKYIEASTSISRGIPAVLLIDDIDTTLGEWENHTGTVNHQDILAFLMHIADDPYHIENVGAVNRVPIFFTGNDFERLYKPLIREGRANRFDWEPTRAEKIPIVTSIFSLTDCRVAEMLIDAYPEEKISFFSSLKINKTLEQLSELASDVVFQRLLTDDNLREKLRSQYCERESNTLWEDVARELLDNSQVNSALESDNLCSTNLGGESD